MSWEGNGPGGTGGCIVGLYSVVAQLGACEQSETVEVLLQPIPELTFAAEGQPLLDDVVELCVGDFVALEVLATEGAEATWVANGNDVLVTEMVGPSLRLRLSMVRIATEAVKSFCFRCQRHK